MAELDDQDLLMASVEQDEDPTSLFIPEAHSSSPIVAPIAATPPSTPPPSTPPPTTPPHSALPRPKVKGKSVYDTIRRMQKKRQDQKLVASRQTPAYYTNSSLDGEAYLEAVRPGQSSSAAVPAPNEDDFADKKAIKDFEMQKRHYDELTRKNGTLSFREDLEFMRIKGAETARRKKRSRDLAKAREEADGEFDLFPELHSAANNEEQEEPDHEVDLPDSGTGKRRRSMPTKEGKQMSMQDAELQSMRVALEAEGDLPRKKKKGATVDDEGQASAPSGRGKGSKGKGPAKSKSGPKKSTKTRGTGAPAKKQEAIQAIRQATSLFTGNVFQQQAGANAAEQPGFRSRNKADALKELILSVPLQDKKIAKDDMIALLQATKDFDGRGQVKADGGSLWRVKGMSTSLKPYQVLGTAFMRRRENEELEPRGGLLADQMGLGKTLMMLGEWIEQALLNQSDSCSKHGEWSTGQKPQRSQDDSDHC
jgi:hypothetical protein